MSFARWCAAHLVGAVWLLVALVVGLAVGLAVAPTPAPNERVTISCPAGTVRIAKIDGVWSCVQGGDR